MSAPKNAKPIGADGWQDADGNLMTVGRVKKEMRVTCFCGFKGHIGQLLCSKDDDEETLWCPQCRTSGWEHA